MRLVSFTNILFSLQDFLSYTVFGCYSNSRIVVWETVSHFKPNHFFFMEMGLNPSPFLTLLQKFMLHIQSETGYAMHPQSHIYLFNFQSAWIKIHIKTPLPGNTSPILPRTVQPQNQDSFLHSIFHNHDNSSFCSNTHHRKLNLGLSYKHNLYPTL